MPARPLRGLALILILLAAPASAGVPTDLACRIIAQDIGNYLATGHPCPCPYSTMRNGGVCGNRSAWAKPNGQAPRCYLGDVDGTILPNRSPNPVRQNWPPPPPCAATG
ncbi:MAG: hypothetical protein JSS43_30490 [Proteobacteria bacterium]|nr:hypothetical protein [Pseudomonadota bacterium]